MYNKAADFLEPIDIAEHLDKIELYLGQVCQIAGISKMQLDYWTNKAQIPTKGKKQRIYDMDALETVMLIKQAKDKGLNLGAAIEAAASLPRGQVAQAASGASSASRRPSGRPAAARRSGGRAALRRGARAAELDRGETVVRRGSTARGASAPAAPCEPEVSAGRAEGQCPPRSHSERARDRVSRATRGSAGAEASRALPKPSGLVRGGRDAGTRRAPARRSGRQHEPVRAPARSGVPAARSPRDVARRGGTGRRARLRRRAAPRAARRAGSASAQAGARRGALVHERETCGKPSACASRARAATPRRRASSCPASRSASERTCSGAWTTTSWRVEGRDRGSGRRAPPARRVRSGPSGSGSPGGVRSSRPSQNGHGVELLRGRRGPRASQAPGRSARAGRDGDDAGRRAGRAGASAQEPEFALLEERLDEVDRRGEDDRRRVATAPISSSVCR